MRVAPPGFQRGTNCATAGPAVEAVIDARHQSARPASRIAGVAAQKSRPAACAVEGTGSPPRDPREKAPLVDTAPPPAPLTVPHTTGPGSGAGGIHRLA